LNLKQYLFLITCLYLLIFASHAQDLNPRDVFKGIVKQSHDNSCGAAALSNLINGTTQNIYVSEPEVIQAIKQVSKQNIAEEGYSLLDLQRASQKLGYQAEWRKISKENLLKIKQPVILVIHLNTDFPHYAVLKGIRDNEAFLADSARGHVRIAYDELARESLSDRHPSWFVMAIKSSAHKFTKSTLSLSDDVGERQASHITFAQSNALTLTTLTKQNQFIISYDSLFSKERSKNQSTNISSENFSHVLNISYGITDDIEVSSSISQISLSSKYNDTQLKQEDRKYSVSLKNRLKLDQAEQNNIILGLNGSYNEKDNILNGLFDVTAYHNNRFMQVLAGASVGKQFSHDDETNKTLPKYDYSVFIGANKSIGDLYLGYLTVTMDGSQGRSDSDKTEQYYTVSTGISYVISSRFQISPSFGYSFGGSKGFSLGLSLAYIGAW